MGKKTILITGVTGKISSTDVIAALKGTKPTLRVFSCA